MLRLLQETIVRRLLQQSKFGPAAAYMREALKQAGLLLPGI